MFILEPLTTFTTSKW